MKAIHQHYNPKLHALLPFLVCFCACTVPLFAQELILPDRHEHPELYTRIQDSTYIYLVRSDGTLRNPEFISPCYYFEMPYDSNVKVIYTLTEWKRNHTLLRLKHWREGQSINAGSSFLSFNTATDTFTCHTGDTLSFYRDLYWRDSEGRWDRDSYQAMDTLDFAMELVRYSDSTRVALIDSIGILACPVRGVPVMYGANPMMDIPKYAVPGTLNGIKTFMRLLVHHRGNGPYWFTRTEGSTSYLSRKMADTSYISLFNYFGFGTAKYALRDLTTKSADATIDKQLVVENIRGQNGTVIISLNNDPLHNRNIVVSIYDIQGNLIYHPYVAGVQSIPTPVKIQYHFARSGVYYVALTRDNRLVSVVPVNISY